MRAWPAIWHASAMCTSTRPLAPRIARTPRLKASATSGRKVVGIDEVPDGWRILDIGPRTVDAFGVKIRAARTVVWNGPMGYFEAAPFAEGTRAVAQALADCQGKTVIGGGDSVAAVEQMGLADKIGHISTGGGASLELLEGRVLPGVAALKD